MTALKAKARLAITNQQLLVLLHTKVLKHTDQQTMAYLDISYMTLKREVSFLERENVYGLLESLGTDYEPSTDVVTTESKPRPAVRVDTSGAVALAEIVGNVPRSKTARKAVTKAPKRSSKKAFSPLEVDVKDWEAIHVKRYYEIRWCEGSWKTPMPSWQAKDKANATRILQEYKENTRMVIDYVFDNWESLRTRFNIQGLPSMSIIWGFRNSIAPLAFGDVSVTNSKTWGSSHDSKDERDDGDEVGW
jgi:hypothetical protein